MTIDNNTDKIYILNDYFQSDQDSYKNGKVLYQLPALEDGEHNLKFKAWDLANNSTETSVKFTVTSALSIKILGAYPNPVTEFTDIVAGHNRFGEKMTVDIEFFSQQGILVDQIKTETSSSGFATLPIRWNPGLNNHKLVHGIYHYRVRLTDTRPCPGYASWSWIAFRVLPQCSSYIPSSFVNSLNVCIIRTYE